MAFTNITDFQYIGSGGELTTEEELFVQTLASRANYNANNVVVMNSNNGGSPGQVLRVNASGTGLEWANVGGIGGAIDTGQVAFGTATNTIGGDTTFTFDSVSKKLSVSALKIGTLSGVLKASVGNVSGGATTSDLPEGANLYWTQERFDTAFAGKTTDNLSEGTNNLYFTNARARAAISANSPLNYNSTTGVISLSTPLAISYGGTGLSALGTANQLLGVNSTETGLEYKNITSLLSAGQGISITGTSVATISNTGILSLTAGSGISITAGQNPTISNTGVLSLNTLTGALTIQGTANQVNVSSVGSIITLSTPQDIATSSSPTFSGLTLTGNLNKINNVSYNWPTTQGAPGTVLTNDGAGNLSWSAVGGGGGSFYSVWFVLNPINTSTWYIPYAINATALTTLPLAANRIYYIPFIPLINITINSLSIWVTTANAGTGQIGIYDTLNYRPNNLLASVDINTGTTGVKSGTVDVSLQAGQLYWLALIVTGTPTVRAVPIGGIQSIMGHTGLDYNTHYYQAGSGGTLPSTASANTNGAGPVPAIYTRYQ